jgi:hypothetical protein
MAGINGAIMILEMKFRKKITVTKRSGPNLERKVAYSSRREAVAFSWLKCVEISFNDMSPASMISMIDF